MNRKIFGVTTIIFLLLIIVLGAIRIKSIWTNFDKQLEYYKNSTNTLCAISNVYAYSINQLLVNYSLPYNQLSYFNCSMIGELK